LQNIVSKHSSQFRGNAQHDALEFLLWLLDRMHEDLGAASPAQQSRGPAQVGVPAGWPHAPARGEAFGPAGPGSLGRVPDTLKDMSLTLSPPSPLVSCPCSLARMGAAVPAGPPPAPSPPVGRASDRPVPQVILAELSPRGFLRSLADPEALAAAGEAGPVYAFQPPPARRAVDPSLGLVGGSGSFAVIGGRVTARSSDCLHRAPGGRILLLLCNTAGTGPQLARFGPPLVLREERSVSWEQLQQNILAQLRGVLRGEVRPQGSGVLFRIRLAGGSAPCTYLSPQDPHPLCHPAIDRALQLSGAGGPPHVRLTVEWDMSTKERLFGSLQQEAVQDAESVRWQQQVHGQQHSCTLDECFQLYTKEEQVRAAPGPA
ncbi:UBP43 hydrolase, partial [Sylvia atricapilla]|nr:UBP43 hydrolase [Sylvia atricapilla]